MQRYSHLALAAALAAAAGPLWANTECTMNQRTRTVTVVYANPGQPVPCEVLYEKPAENQSMTLWRAKNEAGYCEARAAEFVSKLVDLGWACGERESAVPQAQGEPASG